MSGKGKFTKNIFYKLNECPDQQTKVRFADENVMVKPQICALYENLSPKVTKLTNGVTLIMIFFRTTSIVKKFSGQPLT